LILKIKSAIYAMVGQTGRYFVIDCIWMFCLFIFLGFVFKKCKKKQKPKTIRLIIV